MKKPEKRGRRITAALVVISLVVLMQAPGCGDAPLSQRVEEIDAVFRAGISRLDQTTAFVGALEAFDFENAGFLEAVLSALDTGERAVGYLIENLDELRGFDYGGALAGLGQYIDEYSSAVEEATSELRGIYSGLEEMMLSIEPVLREEAAVTQMEAPQSDEEFLERLTRLDAALTPSLSELEGLEVPMLLAEYKSLLEDILTTLGKLVGDLIAAVTGSSPGIDIDDNPDFLRVQELLEGYLPVVEGLYEDLAITHMDPLIERVELEIIRLYLDES